MPWRVKLVRRSGDVTSSEKVFIRGSVLFEEAKSAKAYFRPVVYGPSFTDGDMGPALPDFRGSGDSMYDYATANFKH